MVSTILLSSLEKVFPHETPVSTFPKNPSIFKNEPFNFQVAYMNTPQWDSKGSLNVRIESSLKEHISIRLVDLVPSMLPSYSNADSDYYSSMPGLFPDPLMPLTTPTIKLIANHWKTLWFEVTPTDAVTAGDYPIQIIFEDQSGAQVSEVHFTLHIINTTLPKQSLLHTEWFHTDCIADVYNTPVFSEKHWELTEKFMKTAADHGINMLLTPLFTPPLDTAVGGERTTVQLIDVILNGQTYTFNFDKLERWIETATRAGIEYFEMSHLFTQWGATSTPKIMATVDGQEIKLFGWHVSSQDPSYKHFLDSFLPQLIDFLDHKGLQGKCFFHVSDEPGLGHLENYKAARNLIQHHIKDYPVIDALSNLEFYKTGVLDHPIPASNHIQPFIDAKVPDLWVYYCCSQSVNVSNRFMALPSFRNRIIGTQMFKYDIKGFLHWGYNFYNTQYSLSHIDPFKVTDAGCAFPSGDPFIVYPGEEAPIESLRLKVFSEALYDLRAMELLASLTSREYVVEMIDTLANRDTTFASYPHSAHYIHMLRSCINVAVEKYLA